MKNAAIDRTVGKIVTTRILERVPTTKERYASAFLVVHLLNRLPCPLCPFFGKASLPVPLPSVFSSSLFGALPALC